MQSTISMQSMLRLGGLEHTPQENFQKWPSEIESGATLANTHNGTFTKNVLTIIGVVV